MKLLIVLTCVIAACAASVIKDPTAGYKEGDRYFYFPGDGDDTLHLVDTQEPVDEEFIRQYSRNAENNDYRLFTRANPLTAQTIRIFDDSSLRSTNFDARKTVVVLAHGWNGDGGNGMNRQLTQVFLQRNDVNVIVLDWNRLANRNYLTAKNGVPAVGRHLGQFLQWLVSQGASYDRMHLVGFSLGGHLVGNAGREAGSRVRRITALDPAGPLWSGDRNRIATTDAQYVEVMHTNTFFLGYTDPCGDSDFYPNGGSSMPGCFLNSCSHSKAVEYMAASVTHNHLIARHCDTLRDATRDRCTGWYFPMGNDDLYKYGSGIFRVNTGRNYPF